MFKHAPHPERSLGDVPSLKHSAVSLLEDCSLTFFFPFLYSNQFFQAIICMTLLMALFLGRCYECIHLASCIHTQGILFLPWCLFSWWNSEKKLQVTTLCLFYRICNLRNTEPHLEFKCYYSRNRKKNKNKNKSTEEHNYYWCLNVKIIRSTTRLNKPSLVMVTTQRRF